MARVLTVASAPPHCAVCRGDRQVMALVIGQPLDTGPVPCPHCSTDHLPVVHLPARHDIPRGAA